VENDQDYDGRKTGNLLLNPFYLTVDLASSVPDIPVIVKVSNKTFAPESTRRTMLEFWKKTISTKSRELQRVPNLNDILPDFSQYVPSHIINQIERWPVHKDSEFIIDLIQVVRSVDLEDLIFSPTVLRFVEKYPRPNLLELKTRYYPAREDYRAFYVDSNSLRCLVGAMLQSTLLPTMNLRSRLWYEDILPAMDKNIIDKTIIVPRGHDALVYLGDISSFTSSNVNSWVGLLASLLLITSNELVHLNTSQAYSVAGSAIESSLHQIMILYLYLVVFAPAHYQKDSYFTMGGYLGVAANMSLTTQSFAIFLKRVQLLARTKSILFYSQIGGDDFFLCLVGPRSELFDLVVQIEQLTTRFIGKIKDPVEALLPVNIYNYDIGLFCKKMLQATTVESSPESRTVHLKSKPVIPLMEALLSDERFSGSMVRRLELQREFTASVRAESVKLDFPWMCETLLQYLYVGSSGLAPIGGRLSVPCWVPDNLILVGNFSLTIKACDYAQTVQEFSISTGRTYRRELSSKVLYLLSVEKLKSFTGLAGYDHRAIICLPSESKHFYAEKLVLQPMFEKLDLDLLTQIEACLTTIKGGV
jgi:hypothetical protein